MRGNLVDLAVGFILGGAFSTIVKSLVNDIVMPPLGLLLGGVDFADLIYPLDGNTYESLAAANEAGAPVIAYGLFINNVLSFVIMALALFFVPNALSADDVSGPGTCSSDVRSPSAHCWDSFARLLVRSFAPIRSLALRVRPQ